MIDGAKLAGTGFRYLGTPYESMDCQAFVEQCLRDCGLEKNLAGSNAWFREVMNNGAVLTPEECVKQLGAVPPGAFLFILKNDGGEPAKYKPDGLGNADHIGLCTGQGEGAIHSSASRGCVAESRFAGKTIHGGWNRVGLWNRIAYDYAASPEPSPGPEKPETLIATVRSENGKPVNLRRKPDKAAVLVDRFPVGTEAELLESGPLWSRVRIKGKTGWMMTEFLSTGENAGAAGEPPAAAGYSVTIFGLDRTQADALHLRYPDSMVERSVR